MPTIFFYFTTNIYKVILWINVSKTFFKNVGNVFHKNSVRKLFRHFGKFLKKFRRENFREIFPGKCGKLFPPT